MKLRWQEIAERESLENMRKSRGMWSCRKRAVQPHSKTILILMPSFQRVWKNWYRNHNVQRRPKNSFAWAPRNCNSRLVLLTLFRFNRSRIKNGYQIRHAFPSRNVSVSLLGFPKSNIGKAQTCNKKRLFVDLLEQCISFRSCYCHLWFDDINCFVVSPSCWSREPRCIIQTIHYYSARNPYVVALKLMASSGPQLGYGEASSDWPDYSNRIRLKSMWSPMSLTMQQHETSFLIVEKKAN